jgi:hypothetical protein
VSALKPLRLKRKRKKKTFSSVLSHLGNMISKNKSLFIIKTKLTFPPSVKEKKKKEKSHPHPHMIQNHKYTFFKICPLPIKILTAMYDLVPTNELAMESINCPLTPKSQILISPREFTRMFEGLTSV